VREMIFNEASCVVRFPSLREAKEILVCLARGMAALVDARVARSILRMQHPLHEIGLAEDGTLWDCLMLLQRDRSEPDALRFWMRLAHKVPLLVDLPDDVVDRFASCEPAEPGGALGAALVLCAHLGAITISLRGEPGWDLDELVVRFRELLPDGTIVTVSDTIDNLARSSHAERILERYRLRALDQLSHTTFWERRGLVFPALRFGLDVQGQMVALGGHMFGTITRRLSDLNAAAATWGNQGGAAPVWPTHVTPESEIVMNNDRLRNARVFRDANGVNRLYEWHARFGGSGRIHLRFDPPIRSVEIGYIGPHLPLN
jgi:hypothetical protein